MKTGCLNSTQLQILLVTVDTTDKLNPYLKLA